FDYLKMKTPSIQNDFSYYRRTLSRGKLASETGLRTDMIEDELVIRIFLFYAYPTPTKTVTDVTVLFAKNNPDRSILECLSLLAAGCIERPLQLTLQRQLYFVVQYPTNVSEVMAIHMIPLSRQDDGGIEKESPQKSLSLPNRPTRSHEAASRPTKKTKTSTENLKFGDASDTSFLYCVTVTVPLQRKRDMVSIHFNAI
ncbi:17611_t:CDS:2, partial [Acaulospora morrowiae]